MAVALPVSEQAREPSPHCIADLMRLFDATFRSERTVLVPNDTWPLNAHSASGPCANEPVYLPANGRCPVHRIVFAHGFFASALHEVAHWCIAGRARREQVDYGYWYEPDDRNAEQQAAFERVEMKPQAIELAFSEAAGFAFQVSVDNLSGIEVDREGFARRVREQLERFRRNGFPSRAARFIHALERFYG